MKGSSILFCKKCKQEKSADKFYSGRYSTCIDCRKEAVRVSKKRAEIAGKPYGKNLQSLLQSAKTRATRKGLEFSLALDDLVMPKVCPVLGIPIFHGGINNPNSPSLDRFDNSKGYTKENVRIISRRANNLKNDGTLEELRAVVRYIENG